METFWQHGCDGTSAQNLVNATGLGRGSLYAAYSNKDGWFEQALRRYRLRSRTNSERLEAFENPLAGMRDLMRRTVEERLSEDRRGCLATNSAIEMAHHDPRTVALVAENFRFMAAGIHAWWYVEPPKQVRIPRRQNPSLRVVKLSTILPTPGSGCNRQS
jgi:TetR/AcrR family transcriptional repressor of nem operon